MCSKYDSCTRCRRWWGEGTFYVAVPVDHRNSLNGLATIVRSLERTRIDCKHTRRRFRHHLGYTMVGEMERDEIMTAPPHVEHAPLVPVEEHPSVTRKTLKRLTVLGLFLRRAQAFWRRTARVPSNGVLQHVQRFDFYPRGSKCVVSDN